MSYELEELFYTQYDAAREIAKNEYASGGDYEPDFRRYDTFVESRALRIAHALNAKQREGRDGGAPFSTVITHVRDAHPATSLADRVKEVNGRSPSDKYAGWILHADVTRPTYLNPNPNPDESTLSGRLLTTHGQIVDFAKNGGLGIDPSIPEELLIREPQDRLTVVEKDFNVLPTIQALAFLAGTHGIQIEREYS